jgi:Tfp pilus assembly protein PilP
MMPRSRSVLAALLGAALLLPALSGCGEDEPAAAKPAPAPARSSAKAAKTAAAKKGKQVALQLYTKVEDLVPDADERKAIRHEFRDRDFAPDSTGNENRDPFRSYVVRQPGVGAGNSKPVAAVEATETCSKKQQIAPTYSLRDLRLIGIVLRGAKSFALFRDSGGLGWVVRRNDCLGKEKARVKDIGAGFVTLDVAAEATANQNPAQERSIQLYPEDLQLQDEQPPDGTSPDGTPPGSGGALVPAPAPVPIQTEPGPS